MFIIVIIILVIVMIIVCSRKEVIIFIHLFHLLFSFCFLNNINKYSVNRAKLLCYCDGVSVVEISVIKLPIQAIQDNAILIIMLYLLYTAYPNLAETQIFI